MGRHFFVHAANGGAQAVATAADTYTFHSPTFVAALAFAAEEDIISRIAPKFIIASVAPETVGKLVTVDQVISKPADSILNPGIMRDANVVGHSARRATG